MPRIALTDYQKVQQAVVKQAEDIEYQLFKAKISKREVADVVGLSRQAVSNQFREKRLMPEVYVASEMLLKSTVN